MSDIEQARSMLRLALRDFNALVGMEHSLLFADEIFGFHAQQSIEKALKAWLCAMEMIYPTTHELPRLLSQIQGTGADVGEFWPLARFTPFAVQGRYEEHSGDLVEPLGRTAVIGEIKKLLERVQAVTAEARTRGEAE
jgi:HEPN domain-containing protein